MVEHRIEHDADTALMRLVHKTLHGLIITKMRVNLLIVCRVILVVGGRLIDRCRVNPGYTQIFQVIKLVRHPFQVAAVKIIMPDTTLIFPWLCIFRI